MLLLQTKQIHVHHVFKEKDAIIFLFWKKKKKIVYFQSSSSHKEQYEYNTQQEKDYESHKTYSHTDLPQQMKKNNDTFWPISDSYVIEIKSSKCLTWGWEWGY